MLVIEVNCIVEGKRLALEQVADLFVSRILRSLEIQIQSLRPIHPRSPAETVQQKGLRPRVVGIIEAAKLL